MNISLSEFIEIEFISSCRPVFISTQFSELYCLYITAPLFPAATTISSLAYAVVRVSVVGELKYLHSSRLSPKTIVPLSPNTHASPFSSIIAAL